MRAEPTTPGASRMKGAGLRKPPDSFQLPITIEGGRRLLDMPERAICEP